LLEKDSLKALLRTENELVAEVRGLDGERKALVYDNYSKLISATDTIKKVRPLAE
jgi:YD repeat-containing protein